MLCAVASDMTAQLRSTLWNRSNSVILTSGALTAGTDFRCFKAEMGLLDACWGHVLVLFTSYAAMSAIKEQLTEMDPP